MDTNLELNEGHDISRERGERQGGWVKGRGSIPLPCGGAARSGARVADGAQAQRGVPGAKPPGGGGPGEELSNLLKTGGRLRGSLLDFEWRAIPER